MILPAIFSMHQLCPHFWHNSSSVRKHEPSTGAVVQKIEEEKNFRIRHEESRVSDDSAADKF
jgi:hypothetical protein